MVVSLNTGTQILAKKVLIMGTPKVVPLLFMGNPHIGDSEGTKVCCKGLRFGTSG